MPSPPIVFLNPDGITTGTAELDFTAGGSAPDTNCSVSITGQTGILATSTVWAVLMFEYSADHNHITHLVADIRLRCSVPTPGIGFTIYGMSNYKLRGRFAVRWCWV